MLPAAPPSKVHVRVGCKLVYETSVPTLALFLLQPRPRETLLTQNSLSFGIAHADGQFEDSHGNMVNRVMLQPGINEVQHDAIAVVSALPDTRAMISEMLPVHRLPNEVLRYILPSRYCDSDRIYDLAWSLFGAIPDGLERVQAICKWVHTTLEYRFGSGLPGQRASEVLDRGAGVCRDFAHVAIAFCRALNLPARYVSGHLPDIGAIDNGTPMDFHAYFEVFLGQSWFTFDARHNAARIGRVKIAHGADAVDGAFATIFGEANLTYFEVWAYQINPQEVSIGDPVDLTKRLDNSIEVRLL